jgi:hypothetical protein
VGFRDSRRIVTGLLGVAFQMPRSVSVADQRPVGLSGNGPSPIGCCRTVGAWHWRCCRDPLLLAYIVTE